ncbi:MAG: diphthine--ammonia ligase [Thermoproteota archaeon]
MNAVGLFSGGKDSLYAVYLVEKGGVTVNHLLSLIPSLPGPSPHAENMESLKILAQSMSKPLSIVDFHHEDAFVDILRGLKVEALVAGDVFVEAHVSGLKDVCIKVGLELLEPLYKRDTSELFHEIFSSGFKALITGVNLEHLSEEWLGFTISKETSDEFLSEIGSIDPLGENGEFHTMVLECPLYAKPFEVKNRQIKRGKDMAYLEVSLR